MSRASILDRHWLRHLPALLGIAIVALCLNVRHLGEPPAYIHGWAQADNYSLALGFLHNGFDPLHPQTLIYNKQQMDTTMPLTTITACDLPLHHYLVALCMKAIGCRSAWVYRTLTMAVTLLGLWALYLLTLLLCRSQARAFLVASFVATAPAFTYYSAGFLPTTPALALSAAGMLAYALHCRRQSTPMLYLALLLLTLATLTRTSMAVLWVAVGCFEGLRILRREDRLRTAWPPFLLGIMLFLAWQLWSIHLRHEYGSLFLGRIMPATSWQRVQEVWQTMQHRWRFEYFSRPQHWLYLLLAVATIASGLLRRGRKPSSGRLSPWWLVAILAVGELLFAAAMFSQYNDHDYYFLDSLFLPLVGALVLMMASLPPLTSRRSALIEWGVVLSIVGFLTLTTARQQQWRRTEGLDALQTAIRFKQANAWLESEGYADPSLRFLTLFSYPQNLPFCMMDREGYAVMWTIPSVVEHALTFPYDYILVEDEVYRREFDEAPYILPRLQRICGNGELSLCALSDSSLHPTADHFFEQ